MIEAPEALCLSEQLNRVIKGKVVTDVIPTHPPFSRAFQVPSQAAFSNSLVYFLHLFLDYRK